jgi:hypothetical protein
MEDVILAKQNWIPIALVFSNKILSLLLTDDHAERGAGYFVSTSSPDLGQTDNASPVCLGSYRGSLRTIRS